MSELESPDVLAGGRWANDGLIARWVPDPEPIEAAPEKPDRRCADCERKETRAMRRGLCPACYAWHRARGTIDRFERRRAA